MNAESRIVALGRVFLIDATHDNDAMAAFERELDRQADRLSSETGFIGRALYREEDVFRQTDPSQRSSHFEIAFFENIAPANAVEWARTSPSDLARLQRADLLVPTVNSFHGPTVGTAKQDRKPGYQVSLEYIDVAFGNLDAYRRVMDGYCGPAGKQLVKDGVVDTFRAMEAAATLYQSDDPQVAWNQIHLFEVDTGKFDQFTQHFDRALRTASGDSFAKVFGGLDEIRTVPRWVFCS